MWAKLGAKISESGILIKQGEGLASATKPTRLYEERTSSLEDYGEHFRKITFSMPSNQ